MTRAQFLPFAAILRFTVIDVMRSRWRPMTALLIAVGAAIALFAGQLALTEREAVVVSLAAPLLRLACVLLVTALVVSATVREVADRAHLMALAAPVSRGGWIAAKLVGFSVIAVLTAGAGGIALMLLVPAGVGSAAFAWTVSLALELVICSAVAMTVALALQQVPAALLAAAGVYVAARLIGVIQLINARAPLGDGGLSADAMALPLGVLGVVLPRLDLFARTDWLTGSSPGELWPLAAQALVYAALMGSVAAFDFRRRDA